MSRPPDQHVTARAGLPVGTRAQWAARLKPIVTVAMLLSMWAAFAIVYLAASEVGVPWPAFIAVPMLLLALPSSYMLFWLSFTFEAQAFGIALGLWVTVMFAMTPLAIWGMVAL